MRGDVMVCEEMNRQNVTRKQALFALGKCDDILACDGKKMTDDKPMTPGKYYHIHSDQKTKIEQKESTKNSSRDYI